MYYMIHYCMNCFLLENDLINISYIYIYIRYCAKLIFSLNEQEEITNDFLDVIEVNDKATEINKKINVKVRNLIVSI